jgi:hypothetical protein
MKSKWNSYYAVGNYFTKIKIINPRVHLSNFVDRLKQKFLGYIYKDKNFIIRLKK